MEPGKTCAPLHWEVGGKHIVVCPHTGEKKIIALVKCSGLELIVAGKSGYWMWSTLTAL